MKRALFGLLALILWLSERQAARAEDIWASLKGYPQFADVEQQLQTLVNINGFHKDNQFCIMGYVDGRKPDSKGDNIYPYVYWPTEDQLIYWQPKEYDPVSMVDSKTLELSTDLVATDTEINGSTYLETVPHIEHIIHTCSKVGNAYSIQKTEGGWTSIQEMPETAHIKEQLQELADRQGKHKTDRFCVIGQKAQNWLAAYVYWPDESRLILWMPLPFDNNPLLDSWEDVDLRNGPAKTRTPRSLVDQMPSAYVSTIIKTCNAVGTYFTMNTGRLMKQPLSLPAGNSAPRG